MRVSSSFRQLAIVGCFALLAFLALYNPIFHMATSLPTDPFPDAVTDFYHFHWNFWWIRHAVSSGVSIYMTGYVMAPFTSNLSLHTLSVFWYPLWALLEPAFGTVVGMTAVFVVAMVLTGGCFYRLLRDEGVSPGLALIGGVMLELSPLMISSIRWTNINLLGWFWIPLLLMTWKRIARSAEANPRRMLAWSALLGISLWAMVLTDIQYPLFAFFLVVPYGLVTLWRASWRVRRRLVAGLSVAVVIALVLLWFVGPLPYILAFDRSELSPTPAERAPHVEFPVCYVWHCDTGVPIGAVVLPLTAIAVVVSLRRRVPWRDKRWVWLALVPLPLLFSAGASITVGGTQITMPYVLLHAVFGGMFRYAERFGAVFVIPAVIFSTITLTPVLRRAKGRLFLLAGLFFLVIADARTFEPMPLKPIPYPYSFYEAMGREPYDYVVVEVPTGGASGEGIVGESRFLITQYYELTHGKRMVNGHISRVPISHYWWLRTDDAMMAWLGQRRYLEPQTVEAQMRERIFSYPIGYFIIHRDLIGHDSITVTEILGYFNALPSLVCPLWIEGDAVVYRTAWHPDGCPVRVPPETAPGTYTIDVGSADDARYIGWGWHYAEDVAGITLRWTGAYPQARLYFDLPPDAYDLSITAQAFHEPRQLQVLINGQLVGEPMTVAVEPLQAYTVHVPAAVIGDGQHLTLTLDYDSTVKPADIGQGGDTRPLALAVDKVEFVQSEN